MGDLVKDLMRAIEAAAGGRLPPTGRRLTRTGQGRVARVGQKAAKERLEAAARAVLLEIEASGFVLMPKELALLGLNVPGIPHPIYMLPPPKSARQSAIALSLAKAGSTMFFAILDGICGQSDLTYVNFTNSYFVYGVDPDRLPEDEGRMYQPHGYCYGGFRSIPIGYGATAVRGMKKMLLVRDMRDILVSRYFSGLYTHPMPGTALDARYRGLFKAERKMLVREGINAGVLALAPEYRRFWDRYKEAMAREDFKVWRYEDVVFDKTRFVRDICDFLGIALSDEAIAGIVNPQNVFPKRERRAFIREVRPGDHKTKLSRSVVARIDEMFADYQVRFGYLPSERRRKS